MAYAKRWIALLLALVMTVGMIPAASIPVSAEEISAPTEETQPIQTEPAVTELSETVPEETQAAVTVPEETQPAVTVPEETQPAVTVPEETQPAVTVPEETQPADTVPEETQPAETISVETAVSQAPAVAAKVLSGTIGENLSWSLDDEGTLTISGTGSMPSNWGTQSAPWYASRDQVKALVVESGVTSIGKCAFYRCSNLSSVSLTEGLTSIEDYAFQYCSALSSVTIPSGVVSIGASAFADTGLTSVTLLEGLESLGGSVFSSCDNLTSVVLPQSLTSIGASAFSGCGKLITVNLPAGLTEIPKALFSSAGLTSVTIPEGVTAIGENAFNWCQKLNNVTLPSTLKTIGDSAFKYCEKLAAVTLPEGLTTVGAYAFDNCSSMATLILPSTLTSIGEGSFRQCRGLTTLSIPGTIGVIPKGAFSYCQDLVALTIGEGITSIGEEAFTVCTALREATIPSTVISIGAGVFADCDNLAAIHVAEGNETFASQDGVLFSVDGKTLLQYPAAKTGAEYVIPTSVTALSEKAFSESKNLTKVTIPGSISVVPHRAFWGSWSLTEVVLNEGITEIGGYAFNSTGLTGVTFPESLTTVGEYAFYNSSDLATISIGKNVTSIGDKAFGYSENMEAIQVSEDNTVYASEAGVLMNKEKTAILQFPGGKTSFTIPETVTELEDNQFSSCSKLTTVVLHDGITIIPSSCFNQCRALTSVDLGEAVTEIGTSAFAGCQALTSISIPATVTSIDYAAFSSCSGMKEIHFLGDAPSIAANAFGYEYSTDSKVSATAYYPGDNATWTEDKLQNYGGNLIWRVEGSVEIVDMGACGDSVTWTLDAENKLTIAGTGAMTDYNSYRMVPWDQYREQVTKVVVEEGVTSIGGYAFYEMVNLTEVALPGTLQTIGERAFYRCTSLTAVVIPDSVTTIASLAFGNCSKLETVTLGTGITTISSDSFANTPWYNNLSAENGFVIVGGILMKYCGEDTEVTVPNTVRIIAESVFYNQKNIVKVVLPDSVTEIHKNAFNQCSALKEINIPAGVTRIAEYAFSRCTSLEKINLTGVTHIGERAFYQCESLTEVTFGNGLQTIGSGAFGRCFALSSILLPESLTTLGSSAFSKCTGLSAVTIPNSIESTDGYIFEGCTALKTVNLGTGLREIAYGMFRNCTSLEYIYIPLNIAIINNYAFEGCKKLSDVDFAGASRDISLLGGVEDDDWWQPSYPAEGTALTIKNRAFADCTSLVDVYLPAHLTELSSTTFQGSSNTEFFHVNSTAYINDEYGCVYQKNGTILVCVPAKLSGHYVIDPNATDVYTDFNGCANLTGITFSTGAGGIHGEGAFKGCTSLVSVIAGRNNQKGYFNDASGALLWNSGTATYVCFIPVNLTSYTIPANVTKLYSSALANVKLNFISVAEGNTAFSTRDGVLYSANGKTLVLYPGGKTDTSYVVPAAVQVLASGSFARAEKLKALWLTGEPIAFTGDVFGGSAEMAETGGSGGVSLNLWYPENIGSWEGYSQEMGYFFGDNISMCPYLLYTAGQDDAITVEADKPMAVRTERDITGLKNVYVDNEKVAADNYTVMPNGNCILFDSSYLQTILLGDHSIRLDFADGSEEIGTNDPRLTQTELEEMLAEAEEQDEPCYLSTEVILERDLTVDRLCLLEEGGLVVPEGVTLTVTGFINMEDGGSLIVQEGGELVLQSRITVYRNSTLTNNGEMVVYGVLRNNWNLVNNGTIILNGSRHNGRLENNHNLANNGSIVLVEGGTFVNEEGTLTGNRPTVQEKPAYRVEIAQGDQLEMTGNTSVTLEAALLPENQTNTTIEWSIPDAQEATLATLKQKGNAVTLKAADVLQTQSITVVAESADGEAEADEITVIIIPRTKSLRIECGDDQGFGDTVYILGQETGPVELKAYSEPEDASDDVVWSSSNTAVAYFEDETEGVVTFTGEPGDVTFTVTATDGSNVKASLEYHVIRPITLEPQGGLYIELMAGKSQTLVVLDENGKKVKNLQWSFVEEAEAGVWNEIPAEALSAYASLSTSGKLAAKKVSERADLHVRARAMVNGCPVNAIIYKVTIYPAATYVDILQGKSVVNGKTVYLDVTDSDQLELTGQLHPTDAKEGIDWKSSNEKIATVKDGVVKPVYVEENKVRTGTVTITATAQDGSKKKATVKVEVGILTKELNIQAPEATLASGKSMELTYDTGKIKPTVDGVTWSILEGANYAKITAAGKLTAKTVTAPQKVVIMAISKDAAKVKSNTVEVTILPKAAENLNLLLISEENGETVSRNVTKTTVNAEKGDVLTISAVKYFSTSVEGEPWNDIIWTVKGGNVTLSQTSGHTATVTVEGTGKAVLTATGYIGKKKVTATVTVNGCILSDGVEVTSKVSTVGSGKSISLTAKVYPENATNKKLVWSLRDGDEAWAKITASGKLTATKDLTSRKTVVVNVQAQDGNSAPQKISVTITPLAQSLQLFTCGENVTGAFWEWSALDLNQLQLSAIVYPHSEDEDGQVLKELMANQNVEWKSSNPNVVEIDAQGKLRYGGKTGTVTITAMTQDGSNKKATFRLKIFVPVYDLWIADGVVVGGKSLKLNSLTKYINEDATDKKLFYWIEGGDGEDYVSLTSAGLLKTSKVTDKKTVRIGAASKYSTDEGVAVFTVDIYPEATTSIDLVARRNTSDPYMDVTNQTIQITEGETLYLSARSLPASACNQFKWEVKDIQHGGFVMPDGNLAGGANKMSEVAVLGDTAGETLTVTATALDGTGKKATMKIEIVEPQQSQPEEPGTVELSVIMAQYGLETADWWVEAEQEFEAAHEDIDLTVDVVSWIDIYDVVNTRIAAGEAPDILNIDVFADYQEDGLLLPVKDYISEGTYAKFFPQFLEESRVGNTVWAVPDLASTRVMYYNKGIFDSLGMEPPTNWTELENACQVIHEYDANITPLGLDMTTNDGQATFALFTWNNGGGFTDANGNWKLNTAANAGALDFLADLVEKGYTNDNPAEEDRYTLQELFAAGQVAMLIAPESFNSWTINADYGITPVPTNNSGGSVSLTVMDRMMCFDNHQTDKEMEAITAFFDFFYEDERYCEWTSMEGFLPATSSGCEALTEKNPGQAIWGEVIADARFYPLEKAGWSDVRAGVIDAMKGTLLGGNAMDLLNALQAEITG